MQITINDSELNSAIFKAHFSLITNDNIKYFVTDAVSDLQETPEDDYIELVVPATNYAEEIEIRVIRTDFDLDSLDTF
ncbi:hypothetical protein PQD09_gp03 [Providencia phage PSTCR4]|uniref:Uncharacterized protein n=1 Tax=Providencia phage PSTCR4 TaxID=2783546 RepID=A0A873WT57_9CAUD|nr:hypothetical protein PQD09_gp03 [Providencia phage PSTCR4]QPB12024.1 hypothetical protein [Providencia phage PSTCR4]